MTDLSYAAQAVYDAVLEICPAPADEIAAAALRAAADQVVPETQARTDRAAQRRMIHRQLLAIAAELAEPEPVAPEPPADGEVAELVAWLRDRADSTSFAHAARRIIRVADLLECLPQPEPEPVGPVAVSERLPGSKDCNENGRVWAWRPFDPEDDEISDLWELIPSRWLDKSHWTHWLPAHAIPLPQAGEVEP
jgi:hypothetical protein